MEEKKWADLTPGEKRGQRIRVGSTLISIVQARKQRKNQGRVGL
jgi:hypothetical protein